jgi:hypothetical protein
MISAHKRCAFWSALNLFLKEFVETQVQRKVLIGAIEFFHNLLALVGA